MTKSFSYLKECDGFSCGNVIKKGSLPVNRINESELKEFIKNYIEESGTDPDVDWLIELIKNIMQGQKDEEWFHELICNIDCASTGGDFTVRPETLRFKAQGGKLTVDVLTDASTAWYVVR